MHLPSLLPLLLTPLLSTLTAGVLVVETSTSTYTAAAAATSSISPPSSSSTTTSPTSSTTPASPEYTSDTAFESAILNSTNTYRAKYNATALAWNASLAAYAAAWAPQCQFAHSHGAPGENLAEGYADATDAVDAWGDEGRRYDFKHAGFAEATGHFSQLVWKGTTSVGCARAECGGRGGVPGWLVVCEYWPAGNVEGEFGQEVGRAVGTLEAEGEGKAGEYLAYLAAKMNGGGREGGSRFGLLAVGVGMGMLAVLGM